MRIISRTVITQHTKEDTFQILKNSGSRYHTGNFKDNHFRIMYPTRWHRNRGFVPIRGSIEEQSEHIKVSVEVHSGLALHIGILLLVIWILLCSYNLIVKNLSFYMFLCYLGIGLILNIVIYVISLFDGIMCLDSLAHRLTR